MEAFEEAMTLSSSALYYFFLNREVENTKGKAKMVEVDLQILSVLKRDFTIEKKFSFPMIRMLNGSMLIQGMVWCYQVNMIFPMGRVRFR